MTLEILQQEMITAMKAKNKLRKDTIAGLVDAVKKATITKDGRVEATEELVAKVLLKELKTINEMIDTCPDTRTDLLTKYNQKWAIINEFAPKMVTDPEEIKGMIQAAVDEQAIELVKANRGKFMQVLKGKVDMATANKVLGGMLQ